MPGVCDKHFVFAVEGLGIGEYIKVIFLFCIFSQVGISMIYRIAGSYNVLLIITVTIMIGTTGILLDQFRFLIDNYKMDFIPGEISLEENIVILVAAFGVFLEHHRWLLNKVHPQGIPEDVDRFDQYVQEVGVYLILVAIFMEGADLSFLALNKFGLDFPCLKFAEVTVLFLANILALLICGSFGLRLFRHPIQHQ